MRSLTYVEPGVIAWQDAPEPVLAQEHAALVRPLAVARCDLDPIQGAFGIFPGPFPVGHETVAEVTALGSDVAGLHVGDLVLVPFQVSCGGCRACREGRFGGCQSYPARAGAAFGFGAAGGGHGGAMSDLLLVPHAQHMLVPAPRSLPAAALATLPDNVVDGYRTVGRHLAERPGSDVLVVGGAAASIGLYAVACAVALGAGSVRYIDSDDERLAVAARLGAQAIRHDGDWPPSFDRAGIVIENTGTAQGLECAVRSTDAYGYLTSVAIHFTPAALPLLQMYTRGITFHTSRADSRAYLPEVLALLEAGRLDPLAVPTHVVDWDDAEQAWLEPGIKLVLSRSTE
ncbi:MAG: alcohol dehydrogenase catalytic domain-containing protein [Actinomycetota bacterium]|nr:alcohol dehydrogenase catalytic domain-containing protein [Actinomycetota bacterium]